MVLYPIPDDVTSRVAYLLDVDVFVTNEKSFWTLEMRGTGIVELEFLNTGTDVKLFL